MAELATLARPYAEALFELAKGTDRIANQLDEWSETLHFLATIIDDPTIAKVINNPRVDKNTLVQILLDISEEHLNETGKNLVKLLVNNHRLRAIPQIVVQYEHLKAHYQGYMKIEIASAYRVTPTQQQEIEAVLQKRLGKAVNVNITIDESLLGGWLIRAGDEVIDISIKGRLQQLATELRY